MSCVCGHKLFCKGGPLCVQHWRNLPNTFKTAWRLSEREGGESCVLLTAKVRDYASVQVSIDSRDRDLCGCRNKFRQADLNQEIDRLRARQLEIVHRFGIREAIAA